ncbi:unnamed protein product [Discula destructiva]
MAPPSRSGRLDLTAIFLLFLSLFGLATAVPLSPSNVNDNKAVVARTGQKLITEARYVQYLQKYFPATDHYLLYTGNSEDQLKAFQAKNPGKYYYYDDFYNADTRTHPWYKFFDEATDMDDGEASSRAISKAATKQILVFGAAEYKTAGVNSFYTTQEVKILKAKVKAGTIASISHMAKGATSPTQIMAEEDANGKLTWKTGYKEGTKNASGAYGVCKRGLGPRSCTDAPKVTPKLKKSS